jgi:hypothetical protein
MRNGAEMPETITPLAVAVRELAERWELEGAKAFDDGDTPAEVAEAAGKLSCALELSNVLDTLVVRPMRPGTRR